MKNNLRQKLFGSLSANVSCCDFPSVVKNINLAQTFLSLQRTFSSNHVNGENVPFRYGRCSNNLAR